MALPVSSHSFYSRYLLAASLSRREEHKIRRAPHFLWSYAKVLKTPDFQTSKAASVINEQMKVLMKLYEEMTSETISLEKCKNVANVSHDQKKSTEVKPADPPVEKEKMFIRKPSEERPIPEKQDVTQSSYIVGGSVFGWNFITYPCSKLSGYYGRTKEDFRAANPIPTDPTDPVPIV